LRTLRLCGENVVCGLTLAFFSAFFVSLRGIIPVNKPG
jgi:hypothetical protein